MQKDNWTLVHEDTHNPAKIGQTYLDFRGEPHTLRGGTPPHKPSSTGRVYTSNGKEFFPNVIGLKWIKS